MQAVINSVQICPVTTSPPLAQDNITSAGTTVKAPKGPSFFHTNPLLKFNHLWHPAFETSVISHHPLMAFCHTSYQSCLILALPLRPCFCSLSSLCCRHSFSFSKCAKKVSTSRPCCPFSLEFYSVQNSPGSGPYLLKFLLSDTSSEKRFSTDSFIFILYPALFFFKAHSTTCYIIYSSVLLSVS